MQQASLGVAVIVQSFLDILKHGLRICCSQVDVKPDGEAVAKQVDQVEASEPVWQVACIVKLSAKGGSIGSGIGLQQGTPSASKHMPGFQGKRGSVPHAHTEGSTHGKQQGVSRAAVHLHPVCTSRISCTARLPVQAAASLAAPTHLHSH